MEAKEIYFSIEGMTCNACANRIEKKLNKMNGVEATVNFATEKAVVKLLSPIHTDNLIQEIEKAGYSAKLYNPEQLDTKSSHILSNILFLLSVLLTIPLVLPMLFHVFHIHWLLPGYVQLLLATPVQFIVGWRFYKGAYSAILSASPNMDVLVAMGTTVSYLLSVYLVYTNLSSHLYFEAGCMVITLVYLGKMLEERAKKKTSTAIKDLIGLQPKNATVIREGKSIPLPIKEITLGDVVVVQSGESVPVDGEVIHGSSEVNESMLTGEPLPRLVEISDKVFAGTMNTLGTIHIEAKSIGQSTVLSQIIHTVEKAMESKAPIQQLADKVSAIFVPSVILISLFTLIGWLLVSGNWETSIINAVTVLVISCPCALGLATPTAIVVGTGLGAKNGILIKNADSLEKVKKIKAIAFDKTGTLTSGKPTVVEFVPLSKQPIEEIFPIVYAIESNSTHPLAVAIREYLTPYKGNCLKPEYIHTLPGRGVKALLNGKEYLVGSTLLLKENKIKLDEATNSNLSSVYIAEQNSVLGLFLLSDTVKEDAISTIAKLKSMKKEVVMITGDSKLSAQHIASKLGIDKVIADVLPQGKSNEILKLKETMSGVAMVGDGINDAPALASADVSFAMSSGSGIALETADITIVKNNLNSVVSAILLSEATIRKIKQNLFFAFVYNALGIPLASLGILDPMFAGAAMAMSSISVITNSLLLKKTKI